MGPALTTDEIRERVAGVPGWYHTFEFPGGIVTDGIYDHRSVMGKLPFPESLEGKRCLDLAACNGLFSFEMARRGGEVVSLDVDDESKWDWQGVAPASDPMRVDGKGLATQGFEAARDAYGLDVERVEMSLYDVSPERLGTFDFVFIGNVLLHLSDPAGALRAARSVTAGRLLSLEVVSLTLTLTRPRTPCATLYEFDQARWWTPNVKAHRRLLRAAGFEIAASGFPLFQRFGKLSRVRPSEPPWRSPQRYGPQLGYWLCHRPFGVPSQWLLCN
jgi:tRNA (mo5U34)-methyltransferase